MNVSYEWLRLYCDVGLSPEELAVLLPELGLQIESVTAVGADKVFALEVTANRPDLLSVIGVAREIAAATGGTLRLPEVALRCGSEGASARIRVDLEAPDLCPRYTARLISGVRVAPSPLWLQQRLESVGLRPVNNVVDITNFVLMECGQPLHAFDYDRLGGGGRVVVRRARAGEEIRLIDGIVRRLGEEMLVIASSTAPAAVAGIMGGLATEIGAATKNILLESAEFVPANIRRTSRALGLSSDSSYRFERGVDPRGVDWGSVRAAAMIAEICGGEVASGVVDVGRPVPPERTVALRPARASMVLGIEIPREMQRTLLERLGFVVVGERSESFEFRVPSFRPDVSAEIDLVEEVARAYGYARIPEETRMRVRPVPAQKVDVLSARVRDLCRAFGYTEARTSSFLSTQMAERFRWWFAEPSVIRNPVSAEEPALRTSLVPRLLEVKRVNLHKGTPHVALFELSRVYGVSEGGPGERTCLALLDDSGFASLRGALEAIFDELRVAGRVAFAEYGDANLAEGRAAAVSLDGRFLGIAGEIAGALAEAFDLKSAPAVVEVDFDVLLAEASLERRFSPLPRFPAVRRDLCVVVDEGVTWAALSNCAQVESADIAESVAFLSEYRGKQIPPGKKAIAFSVIYRASDRTLAGEEADEAIGKVARALEARFGARLRA